MRRVVSIYEFGNVRYIASNSLEDYLAKHNSYRNAGKRPKKAKTPPLPLPNDTGETATEHPNNVILRY